MSAFSSGRLLIALACVAVAEPSEGLVLRDRATGRKNREIHDVEQVRLLPRKGEMDVRVRFRRPVEEGVFTCIHVYVDCDDDPATGIRGLELLLRAAVGSRYRRTSAPPAPNGTPEPISVLRNSFTKIVRGALASNATGKSWLHDRTAGMRGPEIKGREMWFSFPLKMLRDHGFRYNKAIRFYVDVEGSISESPISLEYLCRDAGIPIRVDGRGREWSGGPRETDRTGELHPDAAEVDLRELRVDHDAKHLFASVRLATGGFGSTRFGEDDIRDEDTVVLAVEPLGQAGYMKYREVIVHTSRRTWMRDVRVAIGRGLVEFALPRRAEQTRFRVLAWTDARRYDRIPDTGMAKLEIPRGAWEE